MLARLNSIVRAIRLGLARTLRRPAQGDLLFAEGALAACCSAPRHRRRRAGRRRGLGAAGASAAAVGRPGELGVRTNLLTGACSLARRQRAGGAGLHRVQVFSLRDRVYRPAQIASAAGAGAGAVGRRPVGRHRPRRALCARSGAHRARRAPAANLDAEIVEPAVQDVVYKVFARYTVREIFSTKRAEIQQALEADLRPRLAADGVLLKGVLVGKVDLPADYKRGMEGLLAEELETQKMRYTLELKDKRVKETELEADAEKVGARCAAEGGGARAGDRGARAGRGDEARAALQAAPDRAAPAGGRSGEGSAHEDRRRQCQARRIEANGEPTPAASWRSRGLPAWRRSARPARTDGARRHAAVAPSAA
jgi:hypothetical protein